MTMLTVPLDDALAKKLREETVLSDADEAAVVNKALTDYLRRQQMDRIRQKVRPYAEAAGFYTEEDIYREIS